MKAIAGVLLLGGVAAVTFGGSLWKTGVRCDNPGIQATVKDLANERINSGGVERLDYYFRKGGSGPDLGALHEAWIRGDRFDFDMDSFRERRDGNSTLCAALMYVKVDGKRTFEVSSLYSVETTTDGKTMVTAKFAPN